MNFKKIILYSICLTIFGCHNPKTDNTKRNQDSTKNSASLDSNEGEPSPKEIKKELIESYSKPLLIDTTFFVQKDKYQVIFKHFCTMDSALLIPARYDFDTHTDFITSNFKSRIILIKNQDTILNKTIDKSIFKKLLYPELDSFATLLFPIFNVSNDTIEIDYSITIPITDVGVPATIKFDKTGNYYITN